MSSDQTQTAPKPETKRDRVRRLLITPLERDGMRKRHKADEDAHKAFLNRIADGMAYLSDDGLKILRGSLATKGEGVKRDFWPSYLTINALAEHIQHRPLEQIPGLLSWFCSKAGDEARQADRLVSEFKFWTDHKRPPLSESEKRLIADRARDWNATAKSARDAIARGVEPRFDGRDFLRGYEARLRYIEGLIAGEGEADA